MLKKDLEYQKNISTIYICYVHFMDNKTYKIYEGLNNKKYIEMKYRKLMKYLELS